MAIKRGDVVPFSSANPRLADPGATDSGYADVRKEVYKQTGVDTAEADAGLDNIIARVRKTWPQSGLGRVLLPIGYFANVIELDGVGLALCTDGVGSKTIIADLMVSRTDAAMLDAIGAGLCEGARMARISISGGETAQLKDVVTGFDLVGMAVGRVALDRVIDGRHVREGDVVIGVRSNGVHSNGLTLARKALLGNDRYAVDHRFDELDATIGEELLRPTDIYVPEAMEILETVAGVKALINITSDGLLNLTRVAAGAGFVIDRLIEPHPIFALIQRHADVEDSEMFEVFNMGIGFCYVVDPAAAEATMRILKQHGRVAQRIGYAVADPEKLVRIPERKLVGRHKRFWQEGHAARRAG